MANRLVNIVERVMIPHTAFTEALARLEQYFDCAQYASEPICFALLGESRTGKTRVLEEFCRRHRPRRTKNGMTIPVLIVRAPPKPTINGMVSKMLHAYGDKLASTATVSDKTEQVLMLIKECKTRAIIIEEFNHFVDSANGKVRFEATDWVKQLADAKRIMICVSGLESSRAAISPNEQLKGRFRRAFIMPRFDWEKADDYLEFMAILREFESALQPHFDFPDLSSRDMAFRMYCATGGVIGYISNILHEAVMAAMRAKRTTISLADLAKADNEASWERDESDYQVDAFSPSFKTIATPELLQRVKRIGTRPKIPEEKKVQSPKDKKPKREKGQPKPDMEGILAAHRS